MASLPPILLSIPILEMSSLSLAVYARFVGGVLVQENQEGFG